MEKYSVIVPVYNAAKYLRKCCKSVLGQTYRNIELILVDDGSTDNSATICDEFARNDDRVKVIYSENYGVSHARNLGVSYAMGTRVLFLDADDWIEEDTVEKLNQHIAREDVDVLMFTYVSEYVDKSIVYHIEELELAMKDFLGNIYNLKGNQSMLCTLWNKVFKREIIVNNTILFQDKVKFGEDFIFNTQYFIHAKSIKTVNAAFYHYNCCVENSAVKQYYPECDKYIVAMDEAFNDMLIHYNLQHKELQQFYCDFITDKWCYAIKTCINSNVKKKEKSDKIHAWMEQASCKKLQYKILKNEKLSDLVNKKLTQKNILRLLRKTEVRNRILGVKRTMRRLIKHE